MQCECRRAFTPEEKKSFMAMLDRMDGASWEDAVATILDWAERQADDIRPVAVLKAKESIEMAAARYELRK